MSTTLTAPAKPTSTNTLQVAFVGNPNTGKSTLFNRLTGLRAKVGNYPGVTVEKKVGPLQLPGRKVSAIDLPGTYSMAAASPDERIVVDVLSGHAQGTTRPDLVVCVVDATNIKRNLFLASQIAELGIPMVIALNLWDSARLQGIWIDVEKLSKRLGVPIVPTSATKGTGITALLEAIDTALDTKPVMSRIAWPERIRGLMDYLRKQIETETGTTPTNAEVERVLFDASPMVAERLGWPEEKRRSHIDSARAELRKEGFNPAACEPLLQYAHIDKLLEGLVSMPERRMVGHTESIDHVLTHRFWGLVIYAAMMYVVFQAIYSWAGPLMDLIDTATGWVQSLVAPMLETTPMLQSLAVDGIIGGVGGVVIFLPQIMVLFFFISLLEDTGYMARAAFLMDKLFSWCGLTGKSFVPLLSSYACAIPGVMSARTIEDPKARLTTILVAPLMSCSARLPVYILMIGAFIEPVYGAGWAGFALFAMHFVGLAVAIPVAWALNRFVLKTKPQPFILEMPPYRTPRIANVWQRMWESGSAFIVRAGTVILAFSILIWALLYFPRPEQVEQNTTSTFLAEQGKTIEEVQADEELSGQLSNLIEGAYVEQSYMGRAGKLLQPLFAPAGFDWKITVGVIASFPAREVIIATLGIIYSLGPEEDEESEGLRDTMSHAQWQDGPRAGQPVFTVPVAVAIMVFFALCMQCGATVATIAKESGWGWATFSFFYATGLAWVAAVVCYQVGTWILG